MAREQNETGREAKEQQQDGEKVVEPRLMKANTHTHTQTHTDTHRHTNTNTYIERECV